jgi:hypothetical protein
MIVATVVEVIAAAIVAESPAIPVTIAIAGIEDGGDDHRWNRYRRGDRRAINIRAWHHASRKEG